jgi:diguanylate cyclase (GGDEF)-like protein
MVPSPGTALLEIVRYAWRRDSSVQELARKVRVEPDLGPALSRMVARSGQDSLPPPAKAALMVGSKAVGSIALAQAVARSIDASDLDPEHCEALYEDCLRRGVTLQILDRRLDGGGGQPHVALAVGMCLEFGRLASMTRDPGATIWSESVRAAHGEHRRTKEAEHLGRAHDDEFAAIARAWGLPPEVAGPVTTHHQTCNPDEQRLQYLAWLTDAICELYTSTDRRGALRRAQGMLDERAGIDEAGLRKLISLVSARVETVATQLGYPVREQPTVAHVLGDDAAGLDSLTRSQLEKALELSRTEKHALLQKIDDLKARLSLADDLDPHTGLLNRQAYMRRLTAEVEKAEVRGTRLVLLVVDVDRLDDHNRRYGHEVGDAVLGATAKVLTKLVGDTGVAARIGGDEFAMILPGVASGHGRLLGERARAALEMLKVDAAGHRVRLAGSVVGLALDELRQQPTAGQLHDKAIERLETIKGCNRMTWAA